MTSLHRAPILEPLDTTGFEALGGSWDRLLADASTSSPFLTSAWIGAWLDTLGSQVDLELLVARDPDDGALLGAAPFWVDRRSRAGIRHRVLRFVGSGPAAPDHLDLVVARHAPAATGAALWDAVRRRRRWDLIDLDGLEPEGELAAMLLRRTGDRAAATPVPRLTLGPSWEATEAGFDGALRNGIHRQRRRLDRDTGGSAAVRRVATTADLDGTLPVLERLHQEVRGAAGQRGAFATPELASFQRQVAHRMLRAGRLHMWRLDVAGEPIAVIECFRHAETVAFYTTGYDRAWARYGPGSLVMAAAVAGAIADGATVFDFLRGDEPYKRSWGARDHHDLRIVHPVTARGRTLIAARTVRRRIAS